MKARLRGGLIALLAATAAMVATAADSPQSAAQAQLRLRAAMPGLSEVQLLRGQYTQRKFLSELPRPLTSSGEFLLLRDRGIWWHTQQPVETQLTLTAAGLMQQDQQAGQAGAGVEMAASIFFALFALDLETLDRSFELHLEQADGRWTLELRPRDASLAGWFQKIALSGRAGLEHLILFEATGDRTEIDLDAQPQALSTLTASERQRFEH